MSAVNAEQVFTISAHKPKPLRFLPSLCLSLAVQPLGGTFRVYCNGTLSILL